MSRVNMCFRHTHTPTPLLTPHTTSLLYSATRTLGTVVSTLSTSWMSIFSTAAFFFSYSFLCKC